MATSNPHEPPDDAVAAGWRRADGYEISTDPERLDLDVIHGFLHTAYWSPGVPRAVVERSIAHSLPFGVYGPGGEQVGFGRAVTDWAAFAYIADVFIVAAHRRRGLGIWLMESMLAHPALQGLRRIHLATADAHGLYARFGFRVITEPQSRMDLARTPLELWGGEEPVGGA